MVSWITKLGQDFSGSISEMPNSKTSVFAYTKVPNLEK